MGDIETGRRVCPRCGEPLLEMVDVCSACAVASLLSEDDGDTAGGVGEGGAEAAGAPGPACTAVDAGGLFAPAAEDAPGLPSGAGPPGYRVEALAARGGMGVVYRATHLATGRAVAIKILARSHLTGSGELRRFQVEAEAVARIDHPNIVPIYDAGRWEGRPFIAMKWIEGTPLDAWLEKAREEGGDGSTRGAVALVESVARAVHHAHQRGFIHRDLKPSNILVEGTGTPVVTDFGLARPLDAAGRSGGGEYLTATGELLGTPAFMAPEQARGDPAALSVATDVYGLGAVLYTALAGRPPFGGEAEPPVEILRRVLDEEPAPPRPRPAPAREPGTAPAPAAPDRDLETVCLKCLRKRPENRYGSAEALADDLARWLRGDAVEARPRSRPERVAAWCRRRPALAALGLATAVLAAAFVTHLVFSRAEIAELAEENAARAAEAERNADAAVRHAEEAERQAEEADRQRGLADEQRREAERLARAEQEQARRLAAEVLRFRAGDIEAALAREDTVLGLAKLARLLRENPTSVALRRRLLGALGHRPLAEVMAVTFPIAAEVPVVSPDGRHLAFTVKDELTLRQIGSGRLTGRWKLPVAGYRLVFQPGGTHLAALMRDGSVALVDRAEPGVVDDLGRVGERPGDIRFSPRGDLLAAGAVAGLKVWDTATGNLLVGHEDTPGRRIRWHPSGEALFGVSAAYNHVHRVRVADGVSTRLRTRDGKRPQEVFLSPDGAYMALQVGGGIELRELPSWRLLHRFDTADPAPAFAFHPGGGSFVIGVDKDVRCFRLGEYALPLWSRAFRERAVTLKFSADGERLFIATGSTRRSEATVVRAAGGERLAEGFRFYGGIVSVDDRLTFAAGPIAVSKPRLWRLPADPDARAERLPVSGSHSGPFVTDRTGRRVAAHFRRDGVVFWDFPCDGPPLDARLAAGSHHSPSFSPDGHTVVVGTGGSVYFVPLGAGASAPGPELLLSLVRNVAFLGHGNAAVGASFNGTLSVFDRGPNLLHQRRFEDAIQGGVFDVDAAQDRLFLITDKPPGVTEVRLPDLEVVSRRALPAGIKHMRETVVAPGGRWLVTRGEPNCVVVLPLYPGRGTGADSEGTGADGYTFPAAVVDFALDRRGERVFALTNWGDGIIAPLGEPDPARHLRLSGGDFTAGAFSRGGEVLVTTNQGGLVEIWDAASGLRCGEPVRLPGDDQPKSVVVSPDGSQAIVGDASGAFLVKTGFRQAGPEEVDPLKLAAYAEALIGLRFDAEGRTEQVGVAALQAGWAPEK